jgi:aminopeptidase N
MEHVGAIQYRADSLFLDEAPSQTQLLSRAGLIAHETAHMWFGNLVTMEWFNDVWTKEVFANFMAAKIVNPSFPDVNHDLNFLVRQYPRAYSVDRTEGANPIRQHLPVLEPGLGGDTRARGHQGAVGGGRHAQRAFSVWTGAR